jgi:hypothetical protein
MAAGTAYKVSPEPTRPRIARGSRVAGWIFGTLAVLVVAVYIASYFIDPIVRTRVENSMNQRLLGYETRLSHAHLQLLNLSLHLDGLVVTQNAHHRRRWQTCPR